jgi:hypothetical protein
MKRIVMSVIVVVALAGGLLACSDSDDGGDTETGAESPTTESSTTGDDETGATAGSLPTDYEGYTSEIYADEANWLCLPGKAGDVCTETNLDATVVEADGTTEVEPFVPADDPPIDCFYVYPTISADPTPNSDLVAGPEEKGIVAGQAARLGEVCRVFAPMYRQNTLASMLGTVDSDLSREDRGAIAYDDVADAWKHYMANDNDGRGVILIGHSQGSGMLSQLIAEEIDDEPALRQQLVSAMLIGSSVTVPEGEVVGGDFENVPLCEAADQVGCIVSYASFRSTSPPPENSFFGRAGGFGETDAEGIAACTNPAALGGGSGELDPYFLSSEPALTDPDANAAITTDFVNLPGMLTAECVQEGGFSYLEVTVNGDPADPRTDDIGGDLTPEWGLHAVDIHLAMGNLVELARTQADAYLNA